MAKTSFTGSEITTSKAKWIVPYPIADLRVVDGVIGVIYERQTGPQHHQFQNLQGFDREGNLLWTAEHPTNTTADVYLNFAGNPDALEAWNFACYHCTIDPKSGRLIDAQFTK